ncbi:hypothetical protein [Roseateles sp.]|uniref:hypothetical protein n=1 Tax=Roseateles sp. TaxID=1971397 RepID=UPI0031D2670F
MTLSRHFTLMASSGVWGGLMSAFALAWASRVNGDSTVTGLNGPSHWFFGERAAHAQRFSLRHTVVGALTHQASSFFWGSVFAALRTRAGAGQHGRGRIVAEAAALTALAAAVDLALLPRRFTPGFERRLPARHLACVYLAFGAGLAAAALLERRPAARAAALRAAACPSPRWPHPPASRRCPVPRR